MLRVYKNIEFKKEEYEEDKEGIEFTSSYVTPFQLDFSKYLVNIYKDLPLLKGCHKKTIKQVEQFIACALSTAKRRIHLKDKYRKIFIPLESNAYCPGERGIKQLQLYNLTAVKKAVMILKREQIMHLYKGHYNYKEELNDSGELTRRKIHSEISYVVLKPLDDWCPQRDLPYFEKLKILYAKNVRSSKTYMVQRTKLFDEKGKKIIDKATKKQLFTEEIVEDEKYIKDIRSINNYLIENNLKHLKYKRIFGPTFEECGRVFNWLQFVPKIDRHNWMKENELVELDFKSFNPNMLHLLETGEKFSFDPYLKMCKEADLPPSYRKVFKSLCLAIYGSKSRKDAKRSINQQLAQDFGMHNPLKTNYPIYIDDLQKKDNTIPLDKIKTKKWIFQKAVTKRLPNDTPHYLLDPEFTLKIMEKVLSPTKKHFYNNVSVKCQKIESEIIIKIMKNMIKLNINPISIHDSFIIPEKYGSYFNIYKEILLYKELILYTEDKAIRNILLKKLYKYYKLFIINNNIYINNIYKSKSKIKKSHYYIITKLNKFFTKFNFIYDTS